MASAQTLLLHLIKKSIRLKENSLHEELKQEKCYKWSVIDLISNYVAWKEEIQPNDNQRWDVSEVLDLFQRFVELQVHLKK